MGFFFLSKILMEGIDSNSNPADGLSRWGLADSWTLGQQWDLSEALASPWSDDTSCPEELFLALRRDVGTELV